MKLVGKQNLHWYPDLLKYIFPKTVRTFLIYSETDSIITFSLKRATHLDVRIYIGLNIVCLCNLFSTESKIKGFTYEKSSLFCRFKKHKIDVHTTYTGDQILVIYLNEKSTNETLQTKAIISFLRQGKTFIPRGILRKFPFPIRKIYWKPYACVQKVERFSISNRSRYSKRKHKPIFPDGYPGQVYEFKTPFIKWVGVRNCIKGCGTNPDCPENYLESKKPFRHGMFLFFDWDDYLQTYVKNNQCHEREDKDPRRHEIGYER